MNPAAPAFKPTPVITPLPRRATSTRKKDSDRRPIHRPKANRPSQLGAYQAFSEKIWYHIPDHGITSNRIAAVLATPESVLDEMYPAKVSQLFAKMYRFGYLERSSPSPTQRGHHRYTYFRKKGMEAPVFKNRALDKLLHQPLSVVETPVSLQTSVEVSITIGTATYTPIEARKILDELNIVFGK